MSCEMDFQTAPCATLTAGSITQKVSIKRLFPFTSARSSIPFGKKYLPGERITGQER